MHSKNVRYGNIIILMLTMMCTGNQVSASQCKDTIFKIKTQSPNNAAKCHTDISMKALKQQITRSSIFQFLPNCFFNIIIHKSD